MINSINRHIQPSITHDEKSKKFTSKRVRSTIVVAIICFISIYSLILNGSIVGRNQSFIENQNDGDHVIDLHDDKGNDSIYIDSGQQQGDRENETQSIMTINRDDKVERIDNKTDPNHDNAKGSVISEDPFDFFHFDSDKETMERDPMMAGDDNVDLSAHQEYSYPRDPTREDDKDCVFLNSSLYRSVYVYPTWNNETDGWQGPILSKHTGVDEWPWLYEDRRAKEGRFGHYGEANNQMGQYTLELIVRELMTHPDSCLRTMNPMKATLFYVPYLPSVEFHKGKTFVADYSTSPYADAVEAAISGNYTQWEKLFGLTSDFWERKKGADHILVFSEPLHGLSHPRSKRGSHHFINTQKMLTPPIIISVEVSRSFVEKYPKCSAKNIVVPYPNPDGRWFNGAFDNESFAQWSSVIKAKAYLEAEKETISISTQSIENNTIVDIFQPKPIAQYYSAGYHGTCTPLRKSMDKDYHCTASSKAFPGKVSYHQGMRASTFCPCPGGDSPSAKRMFDSINSGCIPVILSYDYVWPFTNEADPTIPLNASSFSIRWDTADFWYAKHNDQCELISNAKPSFQAKIETISKDEIAKLRRGTKKASFLYSFWNRDGYEGSEYPLIDGIFPDGGASLALVKMLSLRAGGSHWPQCEKELEVVAVGNDPREFVC